MSLQGNLRRLRDELGLTQAEMAERMQVTLRAYQTYERDGRSPPAEALGPLALSGVSLNWLVTGHGEMFAVAGGEGVEEFDLSKHDPRLLGTIVQGLEESLDRLGLELSPEKKGHAVVLLLNYFSLGVPEEKERLMEDVIRALSV